MQTHHYHKRHNISIHAPREGGDLLSQSGPRNCFYFNPRPPRGGRQGLKLRRSYAKTFQSTPPARGATSIFWARFWILSFQSTPPARGATTINQNHSKKNKFQSTPPARGATVSQSGPRNCFLFQSTPPARGATPSRRKYGPQTRISIHAPREGGDSKDAQFYL